MKLLWIILWAFLLMGILAWAVAIHNGMLTGFGTWGG